MEMKGWKIYLPAAKGKITLQGRVEKIYLPAKGKMTLQGRVEKMSWQEVVEA